MSRETARQRVIKACMHSTNMSGLEADAVYHEIILPIMLEIVQLRNEIPSTLEKPYNRVEHLLKRWGWLE